MLPSLNAKHITRVYGHALARAQRYALSTLLPKSVHGDLPEKLAEDVVSPAGAGSWRNSSVARRLVAGILTVANRWQARVCRLREVGWKLARDSKTYQFLLACPPVTVATTKLARWGCRRYHICPFCWSRQYVRDLYLAIEYACYGVLSPGVALTGSVAERRYAYDLAVTEERYTYPEATTIAEIFEGMRREQETMRRARDSLVHRAPGGFILQTLSPTVDEKGNHRWLRSVRTLLLLLPHDDLGLSQEGSLAERPPRRRALDNGAQFLSDNVRHYYSVSRDNIAAAVGVTCLYPQGLMYGDAQMVCQYLNHRKEEMVFMSIPFGELRNASKRKRDMRARQARAQFQLPSDPALLEAAGSGEIPE